MDYEEFKTGMHYVDKMFNEMFPTRVSAATMDSALNLQNIITANALGISVPKQRVAFATANGGYQVREFDNGEA